MELIYYHKYFLSNLLQPHLLNFSLQQQQRFAQQQQPEQFIRGLELPERNRKREQNGSDIEPRDSEQFDDSEEFHNKNRSVWDDFELASEQEGRGRLLRLHFAGERQPEQQHRLPDQAQGQQQLRGAFRGASLPDKVFSVRAEVLHQGPRQRLRDVHQAPEGDAAQGQLPHQPREQLHRLHLRRRLQNRRRRQQQPVREQQGLRAQHQSLFRELQQQCRQLQPERDQTDLHRPRRRLRHRHRRQPPQPRPLHRLLQGKRGLVHS